MADQIRATPRNSLAALLSDAINSGVGYMKSPQRTQQLQGLGRLVESTGIPATVENLSYDPSGRGLFTGAGGLGGTTRMRPEALEAAMTVAPFIGPSAKATEKLAMGVGKAAESYANIAVPKILEKGGKPAEILVAMAEGSKSHIFIGPKAKIWNPKSNQVAKAMEKDGLSPQEIWSETGNWKAPDGNWKQEITDKYAEFRTNFDASIASKANEYKGGLEGELGGMYRNPELYSAYPDLLSNTRLTVTKLPDWLPESSNTAQYQRTYGGKNKVEMRNKTEQGALDSTTHELQHAVQNQEGWQSGGTETMFRDLPNMSAFEQYRRMASEAEARAAALRRTLTPEQRRTIFPEESYDIPLGQLNFGRSTPSNPLYSDPFGNTIADTTR
jgi:hypothetical protein